MAAAVAVVSAAAISAGNGYKNSREALLGDASCYSTCLINSFPRETLSLERFSQRHVAGIFTLKSTQSHPKR